MTATALRISGLFWAGLVLFAITVTPLVAVLFSSPISQPWSGEPRDALGYHHHDFGGLEQVATVSFVNNESKKITLAEMRPSGVRGLLIYCSDYRCSHSIQTATDQLRQISLGFLKIK